ncbi:MAG: TetR/AcrR family transcriptional regulator [Nocardioides sp.]
MTSIRHNDDPVLAPDDPAAALLDAAREAILAVGWKRTTLTDVARRAGVSRMTIYRRWPDMQTLLGDLMTREWSTVALDATGTGSARERVVAAVAGTVASLRGNELFRKIVDVDPELLLPYLLDRRGRTQDAILGLLVDAVRAGQADGSVRNGDAVLLARSVLLAAHGFALSAGTMTGPGVGDAALQDELRALTDRYLAP